MKKQGFTLIELMVVIVIMGILAAVAVPKLFGMIAKSKASELGTAAGSYVKLQDAFVAESAAMGDFGKIGYAMKSSETFTYDEAAYAPANYHTTMVESITSFKDGWRATSGVKLNDCGAKSTWVVGLKATSGSAEGMVEYRTTISSQVCADLTPSFGKLATNASNAVIGSGS